MNKLTNHGRVGQIGEMLIAKRYGGTLSKDPYDEEKDMVMADGSYAEIKTQARWVKKQCFTVDETFTGNQLHKCENVEHFIIVEPSRQPGIFRVFECHNRDHFTTRRKGAAKDTYCFPIKNFKLLEKIEDHKAWNEIIPLLDTDLEWLVW